MAEADWLASAPLDALVERTVAKAARDYRVSAEDAERTILDAFAGDAALREAAARASGPGPLARTRAFRDAVSRARERIYYSLRRYKRDGGVLAADVEAFASLLPGAPRGECDGIARRIMLAHASTGERLPNADAFYEEVMRLAGGPRTVVDVGCGVQPLGFPFDAEGESVEVYVAADSDAEAVRAVDAHARFHAPGRLRALGWDIAEGWGPVSEAAGGVEVFDLALLLKLVPVVARLEPHLLETLARAPARRMLVTGSTMSLTKRRSVRRRERGVLSRFIAEAGLEVAGELDTPDETGWMVARV